MHCASLRRACWLALASTLCSGLASAEPASAETMPSPIDSLGDDIVRAFTEPAPLILYGGAVASTLLFVPTGADHSLRVAVQENIHAPAWGDAAFYGGYILPLTVAPGLYFGGLIAQRSATAGAGSAALQALGITFATTVVLKIGTGRPFPLHGGDRNAPDRLEHPEYATEFSPFHFGGYYAWPSGHTSSAVAVAAALTAFSKDSIVVPLVVYPIALGIGVGMIVADRHWTSDVIAGACIGQAVGWSVGTAFRERLDGAMPGTAHVYFVPMLGDVRGMSLVARF